MRVRVGYIQHRTFLYVVQPRTPILSSSAIGMLYWLGGLVASPLRSHCLLSNRASVRASLRFQTRPLDIAYTMAPAKTPTTTTAVRRASGRTAAAAAATASSSKQTAPAKLPSRAPAKPKRSAAEMDSAAVPEEGVGLAAQDAALGSEATRASAVPIKKSRKKAVSDSDSPSAPTSEDTTADPSLPKNTEMPASLSYPRPSAPGSVRITCWNITSLKSSEPKGMMRYIEAEDADIVVLSETKVNDVPMHPGLTKIYKHQYWGIGKQKGYAGLAILSKIQPVKAVHGLPGLKDQDTKGRIGKPTFSLSSLSKLDRTSITHKTLLPHLVCQQHQSHSNSSIPFLSEPMP